MWGALHCLIAHGSLTFVAICKLLLRSGCPDKDHMGSHGLEIVAWNLVTVQNLLCVFSSDVTQYQQGRCVICTCMMSTEKYHSPGNWQSFAKCSFFGLLIYMPIMTQMLMCACRALAYVTAPAEMPKVIAALCQQLTDDLPARLADRPASLMPALQTLSMAGRICPAALGPHAAALEAFIMSPLLMADVDGALMAARKTPIKQDTRIGKTWSHFSEGIKLKAFAVKVSPPPPPPFHTHTCACCNQCSTPTVRLQKLVPSWRSFQQSLLS